MQTAFVNAYNTAESVTASMVVIDVISDAAPTALDAELNDDQNIALTTVLAVDNVTGGVVASGDLDVTADVTAMGYIASLNGSVTSAADVKAATSIGDIVASNGLTGNYISEGTIAVAATTLSADLTAAYGAAIGGGVPTWFGGGVLVEASDVAVNADFVARAPVTFSQGVATSNGYAMGTVYVLAGDAVLDIDVHGSFGGVQVPAGVATLVLNVSGGNVDTLIAPKQRYHWVVSRCCD